MNHFLKLLYLGVIILFSYEGYAQKELDPYKYIIVPKKYEFLTRENQFRVNSYVNHLFEKEGYITLYQGEDYPSDLLENPCLGVKAMVSDDSSAFTTKVFIYLENCNDQVVYRTEGCKSKVKDMNKTYVDALNKCFVGIKSLDYKYDPALAINSGTKVEPKVDRSQQTAVAEVKETEGIRAKPQEPETPATTKTVETDTEVPAAAGPVTVPVVAVVVEEAKVKEPVETNKKPETEKVEESSPMARAFENETISFLLVDQGPQMQAFVSQSKNGNYKPGELIGTFMKTSLPNVFRVSWKKPQEGREETTAYFDEAGNLNIDILKDGKIQVIKFEEVKKH